MTDDNTEKAQRINRRTVLQSAGLVGATVFGGVAAVRGHGGGPPCHKDFDCDEIEGATYVKIEFVIERNDDGNIIDCYFEEETDTGLIEITDWESKEGEECDPISVEWDSGGTVVEEALAFGGTDCDGTEDKDGSGFEFSEEGGSYTSQLVNNGGDTAAISNLQFCVTPGEEPDPLECPDGTAPLARYSVDDDGNIQFEDGVDVVEFENVQTDEDVLYAFDFDSVDDPNDAPETLTTVTVRCGSDVRSFEVPFVEANEEYPEFEQQDVYVKRKGTVDLIDEDCGITDILFCQAAYAEADFVKGDIIEDLCEESHGSDKISSITWSSYRGQLNGEQGQLTGDGEWIFDNDEPEVTVDYEGNPDPDYSDYDGKVSLGVYEVDDPTFRKNTNVFFGETRCRHTLLDSVADEDSSEAGTLTLDLPEP